MTQAIRKPLQIIENKTQIKLLIDNVGGLARTRCAHFSTVGSFHSPSAAGATQVSAVRKGRETNAPSKRRPFSPAVKPSRSGHKNPGGRSFSSDINDPPSDYHSRRTSREPLVSLGSLDFRSSLCAGGSSRNIPPFKNRTNSLKTRHMAFSNRNVSPDVAIGVALRISRVKNAPPPIQSLQIQCYIQPIQVKSHD